MFFKHLFAFLLFALSAIAQESLLFVQGSFEDAILEGEEFNSGGTIVVNGFTMAVPDNLLVQFPAAWVPWKDFVASKDMFIGFETMVRIPFTIHTLLTGPGDWQYNQWRGSCCSSPAV